MAKEIAGSLGGRVLDAADSGIEACLTKCWESWEGEGGYEYTSMVLRVRSVGSLGRGFLEMCI